MSDRQQSSIEIIPHDRTARFNELYDITSYVQSGHHGLGIASLDATMHTLLLAYQRQGQIGAVKRDQLEIALRADGCSQYRTGMGLIMCSIDTLASDGLVDYDTVDSVKLVLATPRLLDSHRISRRA